MIQFIAENLPTILGSFILLAVFISIIARHIYNKKHNKGGCAGGCGGCPNAEFCHPNMDKP